MKSAIINARIIDTKNDIDDVGGILIDEKGFVERITGDQCTGVKKGDVIVQFDLKYFRPAEIETLLGAPSKAKGKLG